jgi:hypothetical protein
MIHPSPSRPSLLEERWGRAGATRGAGGPEPSTSKVPPRAGAGDQGRCARGRQGGVGREERTRAASIWGESEQGGEEGEGAACQREESSAVTGTTTGVKGAQLQEVGQPRRRSVRAPRWDPVSLHAPPAVSAQSDPYPSPAVAGFRGEEGAEGEARSLLVLPGQAACLTLIFSLSFGSVDFTLKSLESIFAFISFLNLVFSPPPHI